MTLPPASGAVVMATGIVATALDIDGQQGIATVLTWIAAIVWVVVCAGPAIQNQARLAADPASLTFVAGTCVLGTRLAASGWTAVAAALLAVSVVAAALLLPRVLAALPSPLPGSGFLLTVACEAIAVLALSLTVRWVEWAALVPLIAGLAFYPFVVARFDLRDLRAGAGDQWVAGGALAIAALASADAHDRLGGVMGDLALVLWILAALWLPVLVAGDVVRPHQGFDVRRWATVFPLGMYAVAGDLAGHAAGAGWLIRFGHAFAWVALAAWLAAAALTGQRLAADRRQHLTGVVARQLVRREEDV